MTSLKYGNSTSCWKLWRWARFDMILTMRYIYINSNLNQLTKFISSSRRTEFKDILPNDHEDLLNQHKNSHKPHGETGNPVSSLLKSQWKLGQKVNGNRLYSEFPNEGKAIVEQILASEERNESKKAGLWESQLGIQVGKLTIWVKSFEIEKLSESSPGLSVSPE